MSWVLVGGTAVSIVGGLIGGNQAKKAAKRAADAAQAARLEISRLKQKRAAVTNPYATSKNLSGLAEDLSGQISNPFASLGVATQAAEIQMEQSDIALANTLDTIRATGGSAGGATALAQAALQSKKGVAASIEQQEAQNEKLKAQGEQQLQQQKMSEQQRLQSIAISEGQRMQSVDAAGKQFMFQANETRLNADLNRAAGQLSNANQATADANAAKAAAITGTIQGLSSLGAAAITGGARKDASGKISYKSSASSKSSSFSSKLNPNLGTLNIPDWNFSLQKK